MKAPVILIYQNSLPPPFFDDARHDEEGPAAYNCDQTMEFEYLLNMPLSSLTTDRIEDLQRNARKIQSKLEVPCHTPKDLYGNLEPSAHYILLIFYNNGPTHQPSPLYMPPPLFYADMGG